MMGLRTIFPQHTTAVILDGQVTALPGSFAAEGTVFCLALCLSVDFPYRLWDSGSRAQFEAAFPLLTPHPPTPVSLLHSFLLPCTGFLWPPPRPLGS